MKNNHPERPRGIQPLEGEALMKKLMEEGEPMEVVAETHGEKYAHLKKEAPKTSSEAEGLKKSLQEQIAAEERKPKKTDLDRRISEAKIGRLKEQMANIHERPGHA